MIVGKWTNCKTNCGTAEEYRFVGYTYTTCKPFLFGRAPFSYSARLTDRLREDLMEYCGVSPRHCRIKGSQICQVSEGSIEDNVEPKLNRRPLSRRVDQLFPRDRRGLSCHLPAWRLRLPACVKVLWHPCAPRCSANASLLATPKMCTSCLESASHLLPWHVVCMLLI